LRLDHVVISVSDLQAAMRDFTEAGFRVAYGGKHADGITENALILFADGSYLELIALTEGHVRAESNFKQLLHETGEGFTGYALYSDALVDDLNAMEARGITISPVRAGGRARPDGVLLRWRIAKLDNKMSPFVIQDDSPREWRVPAVGDAVIHENGSLGIDALNIHCTNFDASVARYQAICGGKAEETATFTRFRIGGVSIFLYRNPGYSAEVQEDIISLSLLKPEMIPQRLSIRGLTLVLANKQ
jgi:catechol 2,3-dioxygenase-like lactoylglutathione lyase family enzyme